MRAPSLLLLQVLLAVGCSRDIASPTRPGSQSERSLPRVWLSPGDMTTNVPSAPRLRLWVRNDGISLSAAFIRDLEAALVLRDYSGSEPHGDYDVHNPDYSKQQVVPVDPIAFAQRLAYLDFTPTRSLPEGWYQFGLRGGFVDSVRLTGAFRPLQDGIVGVRFHVGSRPTILEVGFCHSGGRLKVLPVFSEAASTREWSAIQLRRLGAEGGACEGPNRASATTSTLEYDCGAADDGPIELQLPRDRLGLPGEPPGASGDSPVHVVIDNTANLSRGRNGCPAWAPGHQSG